MGRTMEKIGLCLAAPGCEDGVAGLREKLLPLEAPQDAQHLKEFARLVSRDARIIGITASLQERNAINQDIASLQSMDVEHPENQSGAVIDDCIGRARKVMIQIGIPIIDSPNVAAAVNPARRSFWDLAKFLPKVGALGPQS